MRLSFIILLWTLSLTLLSSQSTNPFDLHGRTANAEANAINQIESDTTFAPLDSIEVVMSDEDITPLVSSNNPFDVGISSVKSSHNTNVISAPAPAKKPKAKESSSGSNILWIALSIFFALLLTAAGVILDRQRLSVHFKSTIDTTSLKTAFRAIKSPFNLQFVLLYLAFFVNVTLFLVIASQRDLIPLDHKWYLLMMGLLSIYGVRHLIMLIIDYVYPLDHIVSVQNYSISIHNLIIAVILLPLILGFQFGPAAISSVFFYSGIFLIVGVYILRQLKGLLLAMGIKGFNLIYFFIYLCAVEIAPFLMALKAMHLGV